jgi:hypothetical protein
VLAITEIGAEDIARALAIQFGMEYADMDTVPIDPDAVRLVDKAFAWENILLPFRLANGVLTVAVFDPVYLDPLEEIRARTGLKVEPAIATIESLDRALSRCFGECPGRAERSRPAPPLSDRKEDIRRLVGLFLKDFSSTEGRVMKISRMALDALLRFPFTSARHLLDTMDAACHAAPHDIIRLEHLPAEVREGR